MSEYAIDALRREVYSLKEQLFESRADRDDWVQRASEAEALLARFLGWAGSAATLGPLLDDVRSYVKSLEEEEDGE